MERHGGVESRGADALAQVALEPPGTGHGGADEVEPDVDTPAGEDPGRGDRDVDPLARREAADVEQAQRGGERRWGADAGRAGTPLWTTTVRRRRRATVPLRTSRVYRLFAITLVARRSGTVSARRAGRGAEVSALCTWQTAGRAREGGRTSSEPQGDRRRC